MAPCTQRRHFCRLEVGHGFNPALISILGLVTYYFLFVSTTYMEDENHQHISRRGMFRQQSRSPKSQNRFLAKCRRSRGSPTTVLAEWSEDDDDTLEAELAFLASSDEIPDEEPREPRASRV